MNALFSLSKPSFTFLPRRISSSVFCALSNSLIHHHCKVILTSSNISTVPRSILAKRFFTKAPLKMSFSNTDTGDKHADPYKEKNLDNPPLKEKVEGLVKFISSCKFGMMTTRIESSGLLASRCMAVAGKVRPPHPKLTSREANDSEENGGVDLIFHTNTESGKTNDLESDPKINISFLNGTGEWASISGEATVVTDRDTVRNYYSPALKAWLGDLGDGKHDGGPEDPRIGVIRVVAQTVVYAVAEGTMMGRGIEIVKGAVTGEAPKVNKLREISEEELNECMFLQASFFFSPYPIRLAGS